MKGHGIIQLMAFIALKRAGVPLTRDLVYVGNADEEIGGLGSRTFIERHPDLVKRDRVRPHRGRGHPGGEGQGALVRDRRRGEAHLVEEAGGEGHHLARLGAAGRQPGGAAGARPRPDRGVRDAGAAHAGGGPVLQGAGARPRPGRAKAWLSNAAAALKTRRGRAWLLSEPERNALLRNTITPTVLEGSEKTNIIPQEASVELDIRLLPDEDTRRVPADAASGSSPIPGSSSRRSATWRRRYTAPLDTEMFHALERVAGRLLPGVPVATPISAGASDRPYWAAAGLDLLRDRSVAGGAGGEPPLGARQRRAAVAGEHRVRAQAATWG